MADYGTQEWINTLNPFGDNTGNDAAMEDKARADKARAEAEGKFYVGLDPDSPLNQESRKFFGGVERSLDQWGQIRNNALGLGTNSRYNEMMGARQQSEQTRGDQLANLQLIANRRSAVPSRMTGSLNQAMDQMSAAADPRARLAQLRGVTPQLARQTMAHRAGEGMQQSGQLVGGMGQIRGQDLGRAGMEQQELATQLKMQLGKEQLAQHAAMQGEADIAAMSGAELDLAALQAAQKGSGIDFMSQIFPGLVNMGAAGAGALAAGPGAPATPGYNQPTALGSGGGVGPQSWAQGYSPAQYAPTPTYNPAAGPGAGLAGMDTSLGNEYANWMNQQLQLNYWMNQ